MAAVAHCQVLCASEYPARHGPRDGSGTTRKQNKLKKVQPTLLPFCAAFACETGVTTAARQQFIPFDVTKMPNWACLWMLIDRLDRSYLV